MKWLLSFPGVMQHLVHQGWYGAVSSKPTTFLSFGLAEFESSLDQWWDRETDPKTWIALVGKDSNSQFKTAQAKAYPPRLNAAIALTFIRRVQLLEETHDVERIALDEQFCALIRPVIRAQCTSGQTMGADYANRAR